MNRIEDELILIIKKAIKNLGINLPSDFGSIYLEIPQKSQFGDIATNVAMRLMKIIRDVKTSNELAQLLKAEIESLLKGSKLRDGIDRVEAKSGFINFFLSKNVLYNTLKEIRARGKNYGRSALGRGIKVNIEFVSANPTGPLTIAHARQAAFGNTLSNVLKFAGYKVVQEYYLNDEGNQINNLGRSIRVRYLELFGKRVEFPESGYKGSYIVSLAKRIKGRYGTRWLVVPEEKSLKFFCKFGVCSILAMIKEDLKSFGVVFDRWASQAALNRSGKIRSALNELKKKGYIYEAQGAMWFKSTVFGDDKDRVVIKQNGSLTYIASDIAYHRDKYKRSFDRVIDIWGPDHHGYVGRLKASIASLGHPQDSLSILIVQLSTLYRDGIVVPMSTREGEFITLREVMDEVGKDAARFFFLMRDSKSHLDFDLKLAREQSPENPVYYVQYAFTRICSIVEYAEKNKVQGSKCKVQGKTFHLPPSTLNLLKEPEEIELIKFIRRFPYTIELCARTLEPHTLTFYLRELATLFHYFYTKHRVVGDEIGVSSVRLCLVDCVRIVLENGLKLLGVSAPKKM